MAHADEFQGAADGFRRTGHFWRLISLAQIPISFVLIFYFISRYLSADTIVDVPDVKTIEETKTTGIPDKEYVNVAQDVVNLIGTFQPTTARDQFETAREFMLESALPAFDETQTNQELNTAEQSDTSQMLYIDHTTLTRMSGGAAKVCLGGLRQRLVEKTVLPQQEVTYCLVLQPREPFEHNAFGLMVSEFSQQLGPAQRAPIPAKISPKFEQPTNRPKRPGRTTAVPSSYPNARRGG